MESRLVEELRLRLEPVATSFTDDHPAGAREFQPDAHGCVISLLAAAARGRTVAFTRETVGCRGALAGLCFGAAFDRFPGGFDYFLSTGRGPGYPEGEGYRKTPELARAFAEELPRTVLPTKYVVLRPLSAVERRRDQPRLVTVLANADQLSALITLQNYDRLGCENAFIPVGSGCQSICLFPFQEEGAGSRAVVGLTDISARPHIDADLLAFTVTFDRWIELEANVAGSFLERNAWKELRERLPVPH